MTGDGTSTDPLKVSWAEFKNGAFITEGSGASPSEISIQDIDGNELEDRQGWWNVGQIKMNKNSAVAGSDPNSPITPLTGVDYTDILNRIKAGEDGTIFIKYDDNNVCYFAVTGGVLSGSEWTLTIGPAHSYLGHIPDSGVVVEVALGVNHNHFFGRGGIPTKASTEETVIGTDNQKYTTPDGCG